jgi:hypothetical protein
MTEVMSKLSTIKSDSPREITGAAAVGENINVISRGEGRATSDVKEALRPLTAHPSPVTRHALRLALEKTQARGRKRGQRVVRVLQDCENFMVLSHFARKMVLCWFLALATPAFVYGQAGFVPRGGEYGIAGTLPGDQVFPALSIKTSGGYLVWQDNRTDGDGLGISALRLDSSFSAPLSSFRVNQQGALDQEKPCVSLLNDGGAVFAWQGGRQGFQRIYARFLSSSNTWATGDILVNTFTKNSQLNPVVATLANGNVVVVWGSFNQESAGSLQGVYAQRLSSAGQKLGGEFLVNQFTPFNQRSAAIAARADGGYVVVWVSEQQRFENSVDIFARVFNANGVATDEFLVNTGTNACANPSVAPSADGGFIVAWMQKDVVVRTDGWDVFARPFSGAGFGGVVRRVNTQTYGDQYAPKISAIGSDYLVVWTSMGQDGSREGVYGQFLYSDGSHAGGEFRVNTTTISQQMHPVVASDGDGRFLTVWTSFVGGAGSFDLFAQRYVSTNNPIYPPDAPFVTVLSSNSLSVTWPSIAGFSIANYEVYADGAVPPFASAIVTNNMWTAGRLAASSTHSYRLAYVLTDGRRSPLSGATTNTTYSVGTHGGIPRDWMVFYWGEDSEFWPPSSADSDGDGVSNMNEFLAGTDPTDKHSVLRIRLEDTMQGLYLNWNTQPGLIYQVQTTQNPGGAWNNLGPARFAAGAVDSMYVGGSTASYYRIVRVRN